MDQLYSFIMWLYRLDWLLGNLFLRKSMININHSILWVWINVTSPGVRRPCNDIYFEMIGNAVMIMLSTLTASFTVEAWPCASCVHVRVGAWIAKFWLSKLCTTGANDFWGAPPLPAPTGCKYTHKACNVPQVSRWPWLQIQSVFRLHTFKLACKFTVLGNHNIEMVQNFARW